MFYEIFFGIILGVVIAVIFTVGLFYFFYWATGGKANYEKMKHRADEQYERIEKRLRERE